MSVDDQSDVWRELRALKQKVARLESGSMLENSSITRGRMRFIGGTLRVDSGGRVEIVGTLQVEGTTQIIGPVTISGNLDITGNATLSGNFEVLTGGQLKVNGDVPITLKQAADGTARIEFGSATNRIVGLNGGIAVQGGDAIMMVAGESAAFSNGPNYIGVTDAGSQIMGLVTPPPSATGLRYVQVDDAGNLYATAGGTGGGPGDGIFSWPFSLDLVTSEFGMRLNPVTGEETMHNGIDFGLGEANTAGTPIPSAGAGTVVESADSSGYGYYVMVDHGSDPNYGGSNVKTRYAHMYQMPAVGVGDPVTLGQTLGGIGSTGNSTGNHLHYETIVDGTPVNPRTFHAAHGG